MIILGIDPGTRFIGYGIIKVVKNKFELVDFGFLRVNARNDFPSRLKQIYRFILELIDKVEPDMMAVEEVFVSCNAKTTLRLGHARGVILLAAAEKDIPVTEYAPREVKQAVTGHGGSSKDQIRHMLCQIFNLEIDSITEDGADALAVALCHSMRSGHGFV